ncbi:hypothetical protein HYY71_05520 [Candidatus Woesearchaeota archaeon]|nr:hypothetical protein [Candidatus Woesearchaeota archaeon]
MLQGQTQSWTPNVQGTIRFRVINANGVPSGPSQVTFTPLPGPVVSGVGVSPSTIVRSSEGVNVRFLISGSGFGNNPGTMELLDTSENLIQSFPQSTLFSNGVLVFRRTVWVDNQIIVDLFPPLTSNLGTGTRNFKVRIRTSNGVLSGPSPQFSYTVVEPPAIVSVNVEPTTVQRRQPLTFTITGSNFGNNPGSIQVLDINENNWGSPLNLQNNPSGLSTNWGDTQIIVRLLEVSNNAPLGYNAFRLKVITSGGVSSPSSNVFTYTVNPASTPTTAPPPPPSLPDLVAEVDAVSGSIYAGVPVNLRGRIRNIGQGIAQPSTAMFNIFRGGETIIPPTNYNIASVAPNAAVPDIVARYSFTGPGTYFITLCANRDGAIQETNSINNCFGRNFEVQAPGAGSFVTATGCSIPAGQSSCAASVTWESRSVPPGETPGIWVYVPSLNFRRSGAEFGCAGASGSCSRPVGVANYIIKLHRDVSNPESQVFAEASMAVTS